MRIAILSSGDGWHVQDLLRAAAGLRVDAAALDFRRVQASVADSSPLSPLVRGAGGEGSSVGQPHPSPQPSPQRGEGEARASDWAAGPTNVAADRVLVRTMPPGSLEQVVFRMDVLLRLEAAGVPVLNPARAVETCVDKYLAAARLDAAGLPTPATIVCQHADAALEAFDQLGGDVVIKPLFGSEGRGMVRVTDVEMAWRACRTLERLGSVIYLQKFVPHEGWDLRVFVLGGRVLAAMRRQAQGDWRTNVSQGAVAASVRATPAQEQLALRAAEAVGAPVCGVDLLPGRDGTCYVLEVNSVPGWRALAPVTGVDVASAVLSFLIHEYQR